MAKRIARELGYIYVDSGAMYRAVTLYAINNGFIDNYHFNVDDLVMELHKIKLDFKFNDELGHSEMFLNDENVESAIRTMVVSGHVSQIATVPEIRYQMVKLQHAMGEDKGIVMDGRDIGTVVFPDAELKIFMTAEAKVRAQRRYDELLERGEDVAFEDVIRNVKERDYIDSNRRDSPLRKADDAIEFDNSSMSIEEQYDKIMRLVRMTLEDLE